MGQGVVCALSNEAPRLARAFRRSRYIYRECIQSSIDIGLNNVTPPSQSIQYPSAVDGETLLRRRDAALTQVWQRLSPRLARSAQQASRHVTARAANMPCAPGPHGVAARVAYDIGTATVLPGEPIRVRLIDLPPGAQIVLPIEAHADSAWLVIDGRVDIGGVPCGALDYQQRRAGEGTVALTTGPGARLMLRESQPDPLDPLDPGREGAVLTTRAGQMGWVALAQGISRCLLAPPQGAAAAYLVRMAAGAAAPAHRHGRAEECLLLEGEMYLDDILLFGGDFQLARAGGVHHEASSDLGVLLVVHGDIDLDVIATGER